MSQPAAVLLDLDGTVADSAEGILHSYRAVLRTLGHEPDPGFDMVFAIGPALVDVMPVLLGHYGDDRVEEAVALYRHFYGTEGLRRARVFPGVEGLLQALSAAGCQVFLATAKRMDFADQMLELFGLYNCFDGVYGSTSGGLLDRKAALIAHILAVNRIAPGEAVMVGDRGVDVLGARANGMRSAGVLWGYGSREELEGAGADALADSPADLEALLLGSRVRRAAPGDLADLLVLYRSFGSFDPGYDAAAAAGHWAALLAAPGVTVVVAEMDGRVVSSCVLAVVPNLSHRGRPWAVIENVVTHPDVRQQRLGRRVLAFAKARAWEAGCYKVSLATGSREEGTLLFYEGAGFRRGGKTYFEQRRPG